MSINFQVGFNVPRNCIYEAFVDQMKVMQYTRAPAHVRNEAGSEFKILDGKILGKFLTLRPNEYIKMEWQFNDWKQPSTVELIFQDPEEDECDLVINQNNIPAGVDKAKLQQGWRQHILTPMSEILGLPFK